MCTQFNGLFHKHVLLCMGSMESIHLVVPYVHYVVYVPFQPAYANFQCIETCIETDVCIRCTYNWHAMEDIHWHAHVTSCLPKWPDMTAHDIYHYEPVPALRICMLWALLWSFCQLPV